MNFKINWDGLGIATSLACAIHCAILPLVLTSLPLFGINIIHNFAFEWSMIFIAFCVGTYSLYHGYKTHHQSWLPVLMFSAGFVFLIAKEFYHDQATLLLIPAIVLIISAHYINYRLCNKKKCASPHHKH